MPDSRLIPDDDDREQFDRDLLVIDNLNPPLDAEALQKTNS